MEWAQILIWHFSKKWWQKFFELIWSKQIKIGLNISETLDNLHCQTALVGNRGGGRGGGNLAGWAGADAFLKEDLSEPAAKTTASTQRRCEY